MGRPRDFTTLGHAGVCNVCGRHCFLHQVGIRCHGSPENCVGEFVHRQYWHQRACACGSCSDCRICGGRGFVATPREDLDFDALPREQRWEAYVEREAAFYRVPVKYE